MSEVRLSGLTVSYGGGSAAVLDDVELAVAAGTTTAVLGGSGSGKTTLLRVVAGFLRPESGQVAIGGRLVSGPGVWVPAERRGVGYVRQDGGLFPHLTVAGNVAFGLPWAPGRGRRRHRERVAELLDLVELPAELAGRHPHQLSGGQQQRVALARALAPRPDLVLLDEPFSALDTALRGTTRDATARALRAAGATAILVTHDQGEALSFADEVAILRGGTFRQVAAPRVVYGSPVDMQVASFLGDAVRVAGAGVGGVVRSPLGTLSVAGFVPHGLVEAMVRPEQIALSPAGTGQAQAVVTRVSFYGHDSVVELDLLDDDTGVPGLRARMAGLSAPEVGDQVGLTVVGPVRAFPSP